jgi:uncharacterized alkaline shock family protein YloU
MAEDFGSIRVSPEVVAAIIALSAASVPGVAGLNACGRQPRPLRSVEEFGQAVRLNVQGGAVQADVYLTVERGVNMAQVGLAVQKEAGEAIRNTLGLDVRAINVYIVDMVR